jgi:outer membrane protein OmpA-like peptidoglycan-associated protein
VRLRISAFALLAFLAPGSPAQAQIYAGRDSGAQVLLYPDGSQTRTVRPLLQPGETDPGAPVHLHMPPQHRAVRHVARARTRPAQSAAASRPAERQAAAQASPGTADASGAVSGNAARPPARAPAANSATRQAAVRKPAPQTAKSPAPSDEDSDVSFLSGSNPARMSMSPAAAPAARAVQAAPPVRTASVGQGSVQTGAGEGLSRRNSIPFAPGAEEPAPSVLDTVRAMSGGLNAALSNGSARIQLEAYGGKQNDKSSDARRLSLKRALIIRQLLIDDGVPSERIDVRAMGGASQGALDRVDVFVRG